MIRAVKGIRDILPDESGGWQRIEGAARDLFERYGYREIRTPIFEQTGLFARGIGADTDIVTKEMYTFEDRDGSSLTLRPEATASIVRAVIENGLLQADPALKVYALGPMFRRERPQKGRYRQFHQVDVEALGMAQPAIDAEIIEMALRYLEACGLKSFELILNSVGDARCRPAYVEILRGELRRQASRLCADCQRRTETNPLRVLDCKVPEDQAVIDNLPRISDHLCPDCRDHFKEVCHELDLYGIPYRLSHRLVRGLDYYTRTTFEVISPQLGSQDSVLGGGRYDELVKELEGPDVPGIGFALGMERLLMLLPQREGRARCEVFLAPLVPSAADGALLLQRELRRRGFRVLMDHEGRNLKAKMRLADRLGARYVAMLGDEELSRGVWLVRDMSQSHQEEVPKETVVAYLEERLAARREGSGGESGQAEGER